MCFLYLIFIFHPHTTSSLFLLITVFDLIATSNSHIRYQAKKEIIEATPEEKIERLEMQKARLMTRKMELERKIAESRRKQEEEEAA